MRGINRRLDLRVTPSLVKRFKAGLSEPLSNGCIEWKYAMRNGYGAIKNEGKVYSAHVVAWVVAGNEVLEGHVIGHKCDNRACCNPEHLECVTVQKNNIDSFIRRKRSSPSGELLPHTVLTKEQALEVIDLWQPRIFGANRIAQKTGFSIWLVRSIINGKSWVNLPRKPGMQSVKRGRYARVESAS